MIYNRYLFSNYFNLFFTMEFSQALNSKIFIKFVRSVEAFKSADSCSNLHTRDGSSSCDRLLQSIVEASKILGIPVGDRSYRQVFTKNYRALFPDEDHHYRPDVLQAALESYSMIWVNGERFDFSEKVLKDGVVLSNAWKKMLNVGNQSSELRNVLCELDRAWVMFEQSYIIHLIEIERRARRFVIEAIEIDREMRTLEAQMKTNTTRYIHLVNMFFDQISILNGVANFQRKRKDFPVEILDIGQNIIEESKKNKMLLLGVAEEVVHEYSNIRDYMKRASLVPEKIDPHLCNNTDMVECLVCMEDAWEKGNKYLKNGPYMESVIEFVTYLTNIFTSSKNSFDLIRLTELKESIQDHHPSALLIIPRLVTFHYLIYHQKIIYYNDKKYNKNNEILPLELFIKWFKQPDNILYINNEIQNIPYEMKPLFDSFEDILNFNNDFDLTMNITLSKILDIQCNINNNGDIMNNLLNNFSKNIEYISLLAQRTYTVDWNEYLQITLNCFNTNEEPNLLASSLASIGSTCGSGSSTSEGCGSDSFWSPSEVVLPQNDRLLTCNDEEQYSFFSPRELRQR
eukprot:GHVL01038388.1.p1 GENE.GHVL01038388.1~~GHVL01038388.1.p1  ORF type:complete len:571 (+),score=143.75 GHVL01038388.1:24-1736(+)